MTSLPIQTTLDASLDFVLPAELEATRPPEARGLLRDEVRLMVSYHANDHIVHDRFREIEHFLDPGDLLIINTSGTMNAALNATRADGTSLEVHLSTHLPANLWIVEVRLKRGKQTFPFSEMQAGERVPLPGGASLHLLTPYSAGEGRLQPARQRLWIAALELASPLQEYLTHYGFPIRYNYVPEAWPLEYYQTVYATEYGSAEMPSAGRAFTPDLIARLVARGIQIMPLLLHTGVSSLEEHEPPYEEYYRVPVETAKSINTAKAGHKRVVAVGTTVVRALETVTDVDGVTHPGEGWTRLVITPQRGLRAVNALLTGLHEPRASHLLMLEALAGREHLRKTYAAALQEQYLWHEFGDLHLLLP